MVGDRKKAAFGVEMLHGSHLVATSGQPQSCILDRLETLKRRARDIGGPRRSCEVDLGTDEGLVGEKKGFLILAP